MRLVDLDPVLLTYQRDGLGNVTMPRVSALADAQGVMFLCPLCFKRNGGAPGTHLVICWSRSRGVPDFASPGPGRWALLGSSLEDLTLAGDPGSDSVHLQGGCGWHGFVRGGQVVDA